MATSTPLPGSLTRPLRVHRLVPPNPYLHDDQIPPWLRFYSRAPSESDHKLVWGEEHFELDELNKYDGMLIALYKQESGVINASYEAYVGALQSELDRRKRILLAGVGGAAGDGQFL